MLESESTSQSFDSFQTKSGRSSLEENWLKRHIALLDDIEHMLEGFLIKLSNL